MLYAIVKNRKPQESIYIHDLNIVICYFRVISRFLLKMV